MTDLADALGRIVGLIEGLSRRVEDLERAAVGAPMSEGDVETLVRASMRALDQAVGDRHRVYLTELTIREWEPDAIALLERLARESWATERPKVEAGVRAFIRDELAGARGWRVAVRVPPVRVPTLSDA